MTYKVIAFTGDAPSDEAALNTAVGEGYHLIHVVPVTAGDAPRAYAVMESDSAHNLERADTVVYANAEHSFYSKLDHLLLGISGFGKVSVSELHEVARRVTSPSSVSTENA